MKTMFQSIRKSMSFKQLYLFANILAIAPPYHSTTRKVCSTYLFKCYALIVGGLVVTISVVFAWIRTSIYIADFPITLEILDETQHLVIVVTHLTIIHGALARGKTWEKLLNNLSSMADNMRIDKSFISDYWMDRIIIGHIVMILVFGYEWKTIYDKFHMELSDELIILAYSYLPQFFQLYLMFYLTILMNVTLKCFQRLLEKMNGALLKTNKTISFGLETLVSNYGLQRISIVRNIAKNYRILSETVDLFNNIFGKLLLAIMINSIATLLMLFNLMLYSFYSNYHMVIAALLTALFMLMWILSVVALSNKVVTEAKRTIDIGYLLQENLSAKSEERKEIFLFLKMAEFKMPRFNAAGLVDITPKVLVTILSIVTTYLIVLLQFNVSKTFQPPITNNTCH